MSYLAEVTAVITDFPAFQSLAGSVDLQDLRYRIVATLASLALIILPIKTISNRDGGTQFKRDWPLVGLSLTGLISLSLLYTNLYEDTMRGVVEWNDKQEVEFIHEHPEAP
jgi:hypothetical protein